MRRVPPTLSSSETEKTLAFLEKARVKSYSKPDEADDRLVPVVQSMQLRDSKNEPTRQQEAHFSRFKDVLGLKTEPEIKEAKELLEKDPQSLQDLVDDRRRGIDNCTRWLENYVKPLHPITDNKVAIKREASVVTIKVLRAPKSQLAQQQTMPKEPSKLRVNKNFFHMQKFRQG